MCVLYHTLLDTGKWPLESPCAVDSEGGSWGEEGGGEFRPNEWKPGMCVGEGGKGGGIEAGPPPPLHVGARLWAKKEEGNCASVVPSFVVSLFLLTSLGRRLLVLGRRLPARGGVEIMSLFR